MSFDGNSQAVVVVQPNEGLIAARLLRCHPDSVIPQVDELADEAANNLIATLLTPVTTLKLPESLTSAIVQMPDVDGAVDETAPAAEAGAYQAPAKRGEFGTAERARATPDMETFAKAGRDLVSIMILPSGQAQPQERFFAGDTLLGILPHLPASDLVSLTRTVSRLDVVSERLRTYLVTHSDTDISCRMLKDAHYISDVDLLGLMPTASEQQLRLIARRRLLNVVVCDAIIETGNSAAILELLRNAESQLSTSAFVRLMQVIRGNRDLEAAMCNRADLPQAIGLQLFWQVGQNLRRYILSRFLAEAAALGRVMSTGMKVDVIPLFGGNASPEDIETLISQVEEGDPEAAATLSHCCRIAPETAAKIVNDPGGEPLVVAFKCLAQSRLVMAQALQRWLESGKCPINGDNRLVELHAQFDGMSFNKARMLVAYWDWAAGKAGPFAT